MIGRSSTAAVFVAGVAAVSGPQVPGDDEASNEPHVSTGADLSCVGQYILDRLD